MSDVSKESLEAALEAIAATAQVIALHPTKLLIRPELVQDIASRTKITPEQVLQRIKQLAEDAIERSAKK